MAVATIYADRDASRAVSGVVSAGATNPLVVVSGKYMQNHLMRFPVNTLPASAVISAVSLNVYVEAVSAWTAAETSMIKEVTSAWTESPGGETANLGTAYNALVTLLAAGTTAGMKTVSHALLLSMVQAWFAGTLVNNGLAITGEGGTVDDGDQVTTRSRESASPPYLSITYTSNPNAPAWGANPVNGAIYDATVPYIVTGTDPDGDAVTADIAYSVDGSTWVTAATAVALSGNLNSTAWPDSTTMRLRARLRDGSGNLSGYTVDSKIFTVRHTSYMKVWTGAAWVLKPLKRWNGSAWVGTKLKRWTGSAWVDE